MPSRLCTLRASLLVLTCVACGAQNSIVQGGGDAAPVVAGLDFALAGGAAQVPLVSSSPLTAAVAQALQSWGVSPGTRLHAVAATTSETPLLRNWVRHARAGRIPHLALLALDADTVATGEKLKLLTLDVTTLVANTPFTGTAGLVPVLRAALSYGVDVLLSEPDVVWLRNPEMYLAVYDMLAADLLVASQCRYHFVARPNLDSRTQALREPVESEVSLAVVGVKPSPGGLSFIDAWMESLLAVNGSSSSSSGKRGEQVLVETFREALWMGGQQSPRKVAWLSDVPGGSWDVAAREDLFPRYPPRVNDGTQVMPYKARNETLGVGILPVGLFANPHTWFAARLPVHYRLRPYSLHAGSLQAHAGAQLRLREAGLWLQGDASTAPRVHNATLRLRMQLPADLASAALAAAGNRTKPWDRVALWQAHVAMVTWQLQRVGEAAVLAAATGRFLELPDLHCACDEADGSPADGSLEDAPPQGGCGPGETPPPPFQCSLAAGFKAASVEAALADGSPPPQGFSFHIAAAAQLRKQQGVRLRLCRSMQQGVCRDAVSPPPPDRDDDRFDTDAELQGEQSAAQGVTVDVAVQSPLAALVAALGPHAKAPVVEVTLDAADALFAPISVPADTAAAVAGQLASLSRVRVFR